MFNKNIKNENRRERNVLGEERENQKVESWMKNGEHQRCDHVELSMNIIKRQMHMV